MKINLSGRIADLRARLMPDDEMSKNRGLVISENCINNVVANLVGGNFFTGLLLFLNASTLQIGLVNIITYVCNLLQLFSPLFLERFASRKRMLIFTRALSHILNILLIGLISILPADGRVRVYLILGTIALLSTVAAFTSPGFSIWHIQSVPERERANYFAQNQRAVSLTSHLFIVLGGMFVDMFRDGDQLLTGFLILRAVAVVLAAADLYILAKIKEYPYPASPPPRLSTLFTLPFRQKRYLVSVLIIFLWNLLATTTGSYYTVYLLNTLKVSYSFMNLTSAMYVPFILFLGPVWARLINRTSWLAVFWKALLLYGLFHCLHSFVTPAAIWFYPVVVLLCFFLSPAINIVMANMTFYNIPRENQTVYLSFCSAASMLAAILGNTYATQFMLATEHVSFHVLGVTMQNNQFMPIVTGLLIMLLGGIVFFLNRRENVNLRRDALLHPEAAEAASDGGQGEAYTP